jgi:hypothetical protein
MLRRTRGRLIVDAMAAQWGSFRLSDDGTRVVWCDLGQPLRVPAADVWAWLPPVLAGRPLAPLTRTGVGAAPGALARAGTGRAGA